MDAKLPTIDLNTIATVDEAKQIIIQLLNIIEQQRVQIAKLTKGLEQANAEIARLKGQPKKPHFSSKKPSHSISSFLKGKPDEKNSWHKSIKQGKLPIDEHVTLAGTDVCACGSHDFHTIRTKIKIVQGMIIRRNNAAYHAPTKQCDNCGKIYNTSFPIDTKGLSFDSTIQTLVSYMKFDGRFTHPLLHRFFTGFGIRISYGEITTIMQRNSEKLVPSFKHLRTTGVRLSRYLQSDATGSKRKHKSTGKIFNQHLHILGNSLLSIFKITRRYNAKEMNKLLGSSGKKKPFVSDDGSPNGECLKCKEKQVCWVHEIRHYKKLFPFFNSHQKLQKKILGQWRKFYHLAKSYGPDPTEKKREEIESMFARITSQKTGYDLLDKQLRLTGKKKDRLLLFLTYPFVPIQNNQCEQDLREFVIIRKISGETKSDAGDRSIERHLSVIQTAKKQGLDVFQTLHGLLTGALSPAILTAKSV